MIRASIFLISTIALTCLSGCGPDPADGKMNATIDGEPFQSAYAWWQTKDGKLVLYGSDGPAENLHTQLWEIYITAAPPTSFPVEVPLGGGGATASVTVWRNGSISQLGGTTSRSASGTLTITSLENNQYQGHFEFDAAAITGPSAFRVRSGEFDLVYHVP